MISPDAHAYVLHLAGSEVDGEEIRICGTRYTREDADRMAAARARAIDARATVTFVGLLSSHDSDRSRVFEPALELELLPWWARQWIADQESRPRRSFARPGTTKAIADAYGPRKRKKAS